MTRCESPWSGLPRYAAATPGPSRARRPYRASAGCRCAVPSLPDIRRSPTNLLWRGRHRPASARHRWGVERQILGPQLLAHREIQRMALPGQLLLSEAQTDLLTAGRNMSMVQFEHLDLLWTFGK